MANNSICGIGVAYQANIGGEYKCFGWFVYVCVCGEGVQIYVRMVYWEKREGSMILSDLSTSLYPGANTA